MFNIFKRNPKQSKADKRLAEFGFTKTHEDDMFVVYSRHVKKHDYFHVVTIQKKSSGEVRITSYDKTLFARTESGIPAGNCAVAVTPKEMKAILQKIKERRW